MGPAGPGLITTDTLAVVSRADAVFLRTSRHPSSGAFRGARSFDHHYEREGSFDDVYRAIVADITAASTTVAAGTDDAPDRDGVRVVYAVPGSPTVAERTVSMLREHPAVSGGEIILEVHPAVSFLDLAFARIGVDPVTAGVKVVDGESFAVEAAGQSGPLLVAQCWNPTVLSAIKLSVEPTPTDTVTVLHHLGLPDELVRELAWDDLDRSFTPDHLTSLWIPHLASPAAAELVRLDELVHTLRQRCPWDREQTHGSLARHLLEESYEVLEAIDVLAALDAAGPGGAAGAEGADAGGDGDGDGEGQAVADLEEELGDLLFQVYFHAMLGAEAGRFTLADVARGVHDKLVSRHPHVFGDGVADTPAAVALNWEALKKSEKNRSSVTEGIPAALPALSLAAKLQRKAEAVGMVLPGLADEAARLAEGVAELEAGDTHAGSDGRDPERGGIVDGQGGRSAHASELGDLLFALVNMSRRLGIDPETALRARAAIFRASVEEQG